MSYRGRRTQGSGEPSTSKSTRVSRIAQPIRRPSLRQQSLERANNDEQRNNASYLSASAAKAPRNSSATPLRTPNRPIPYSSVNVMTSEKERMPLDDKKLLQTQAARVTEYLHEIEDILGKDFFPRGGLKSMSTKQFVAIFSHLLNFVAGTRLSIGTNYVDDIGSVLSHIDYPYTINKSWLKTPSAPHAFNNVIILFGWMLDFVPRSESSEEYEREYTVVDDIMDQEFALKFNSSAKLGFSLWNNNKYDEFNNLKTEITNIFIEKHLELQQCETTIEGIQKLIARLNTEVEQLAAANTKEKGKVVALAKDFKRLEDQHVHKKQKQAKLEKFCHDNQRKIFHLQELRELKERQIAEIQDRIDCIETSIKAQKMTVSERTEIINQLQYLKHLLESEKNANNELQFKYESHQVSYSRLMKRTLDVVATFNTQLQQIFSDQSDLVGMKVEEICLDRNSEKPLEEQVERVLPLLEKAKHSVFQQIKVYTLEISEVQQKLKTATYEHDNLLEMKLKSIEQKCDEYTKIIGKLDEQIVNLTAALNEKIQCALETLKNHVTRNDELKEKCAAKQQEITNIIEENKEILALATQKIDAYLEERKRNVDSLGEDVKELCRMLEHMHLKFRDFGN